MKNIFLVLLLLPTLAIADDDLKCNPEGSNLEMATCANDSFKTADKDLNKLYAKLITEAKHDDKENTGGDQRFGGYESALRESQRAWIAFRDKDCLRQTTGEMGGSIRQIEYPACLEEMTKERIKELSK